MTAHARIKCTIWRDGEFRDLSVDAQWTYQRLLSDSNRNQAGVLALTRKRWAGSAAGMTRDRLDAALDELVAGHFVVLDEDTEEVLIRTYIRHNEIASQPNILKAALQQAQRVESPLLRAALAAELRLLPPKPDDTARMTYPDPHAVAEVIEVDEVDEVERRLRVVPAAPVSAGRRVAPKGSGKGSQNPSRNPQEQEQEQELELEGGVQGGLAIQSPLIELVPVPVPKPAPRTTGTRLTEDWKPSPDTITWTRGFGPHVDITAEWAKFQDYWMSRAGAGARKVDWDRTWKNWVRKADEDARRRVTRTAGPSARAQRLDHSKSIVERFAAMEESQSALPEWRAIEG